MGWPRRAPNPVRRRVSAPNEHVHVPSSNATIGIDIGKSMPKHCYVYAIDVDGVRRYIGKGSNGRMYAHMKEVRQRLTRKFKLKNISPVFQRKLTEAVMKGAVVETIVLAENLTSKQAYQLEYRHLEKMVYTGKRQQLWNVIPPTICTPEEHQAYMRKLMDNLTSKDRWTRLLAGMQLKRLARYERSASPRN
jgi:hypothetical protein